MPVKKKVAKKRGRKSNTLTPKRLLFCFEYLIDQNGTRAAIRAGYSSKTAASTAVEILKVSEVQSVIKAGLAAKIERCKVDADWVLKEQVKVYERCMTVHPILDHDGSNTGEFKFDASGANKALENIGKHVDINAFKATDDKGVPIDQNWVTTIVHTDAKSYAARKA